VVPNHACATVNMQNEIWRVSEDEVVDHWNVAGRGLVR